MNDETPEDDDHGEGGALQPTPESNWKEHEIPPWGGRGYGLPFRPDKITAVDPAEFREAVLACSPAEWPKEYPAYWTTPLVDAFSRKLMNRTRMSNWQWTPIYHRFTALLRLLEAGHLGPGWPKQDELLKSEQSFVLHPALLHAASQLPLSAEAPGDFDPVVFRREAVRVAKTMGSTLPPGIEGQG